MTECKHCGAHVTESFARVMGDNDNEVHGCPDCEPATDLLNGSAAGLDSQERKANEGASA